MMKAIAKFLESQGCSEVRTEGTSIYFVSPNALSGVITRHRGGAITEVLDGETNEFRNLADLRRAWTVGAEEVSRG